MSDNGGFSSGSAPPRVKTRGQGEASPKSQSQQRTHAEPPLTGTATGARSAAFEIEVNLSPEALEVVRQRIAQRLLEALANSHQVPAGLISDLFADLEALSKTRPAL